MNDGKATIVKPNSPRDGREGFLKTRQSVAGYSKYAAGAIATHSSGRKNIDLNPSTQPSLDLAINFPAWASLDWSATDTCI